MSACPFVWQAPIRHCKWQWGDNSSTTGESALQYGFANPCWVTQPLSLFITCLKTWLSPHLLIRDKVRRSFMKVHDLNFFHATIDNLQLHGWKITNIWKLRHTFLEWYLIRSELTLSFDTVYLSAGRLSFTQGDFYSFPAIKHGDIFFFLQLN